MRGRPAGLTSVTDGKAQPTADLSASPSATASSGDNSTTSRPPPSSGTRITMPRPSLVTSSGPSPVRGFIAAIRHPLSYLGPQRPRRGPAAPARVPGGTSQPQRCRSASLLSRVPARSANDQRCDAMPRVPRGPAGAGRDWERARDIGAFRPLRRSSAVTRLPGSGRGPGPAAGAARDHRAGGAHGGVPDVQAGMAGCGAAAGRGGLRTDAARGPQAGRGRGAHLPLR
jgi:hypothetical protein